MAIYHVNERTSEMTFSNLLRERIGDKVSVQPASRGTSLGCLLVFDDGGLASGSSNYDEHKVVEVGDDYVGLRPVSGSLVNYVPFESLKSVRMLPKKEATA